VLLIKKSKGFDVRMSKIIGLGFNYTAVSIDRIVLNWFNSIVPYRKTRDKLSLGNYPRIDG